LQNIYPKDWAIVVLSIGDPSRELNILDTKYLTQFFSKKYCLKQAPSIVLQKIDMERIVNIIK